MNRFRRLKLENSKRIIKLYSNRFKKRVYRKGGAKFFFLGTVGNKFLIFWAGRLPLKTAFPNYGVKLMKFMKTKAAVVLTAISALPMAAHAALSDTVKNAINGGFTDAQEAAGLIIGGLAVLFGILLVKRLLR